MCISWDANGPDFVTDISNYNWFSVASSYEDRNNTYANPYMRWALFYKQIKLANDILNAIPADTDIEILKYYRGQALAVRAFDYLSLVPYYQFKYKGHENEPAVPIVTNDMTGDPSNNPRASVNEVYELIMSDLNTAIELLEGYERTSKGAINQQVAYGLRARANLYMENWEAAASDADNALEGFPFYSREDVSQPTLHSSTDPNWIWAVVINADNVPDNLATWPSKLGSFTGYGYSTAVQCYKSVNKILWDLIPTSDVRKGWWVDENLESPNLDGVVWEYEGGQAVGNEIPQGVSDISAPYFPYTNVKFGMKSGIGSTANDNDWCIMRAEEMLLIKAEATGMTNEAAGKQILQDFVTEYRDPDYDVNASTRSFQDEVWFQRRVELWGEGFAMADIMRLGKNVVRFKEGAETNFPLPYRFNIASDNGWLLLRLPVDEVNANGGISPADDNTDGVLPVSGDNPTLTDGVTD